MSSCRATNANPDTFGTADQFAAHAVHYLAEIEKALGETRDEGGRLLTVNQQHVAKAVAEERERCAKIAEAEATKLEEYSETVSDDARFNGVTTGIDSLREVAAAIRGAK